MSQITRERSERVPVSVFVDRDQRERLVALARAQDSSLSRIVRRALSAELERERKESE